MNRARIENTTLVPLKLTSTSRMSPSPRVSAAREIDFWRRGRGAIAHEEVRADLEAMQLACVGLRHFVVFRVGNRTLHVEHRKIERHRIADCPLADRYVLPPLPPLHALRIASTLAVSAANEPRAIRNVSQFSLRLMSH